MRTNALFGGINPAHERDSSANSDTGPAVKIHRPGEQLISGAEGVVEAAFDYPDRLGEIGGRGAGIAPDPERLHRPHDDNIRPEALRPAHAAAVAGM
nr:hypothetical protein [Kitasatospora purpeofusca]